MSDLGIVRNGAVLIHRGRVVATGSALHVRNVVGARRVTRLDAEGQVVMPGFVDSHTHALFLGSRVDEYIARLEGHTYEEIARQGGGIQRSAAAIRRARLPELMAHLDAVSQRLLAYGTTTVEIKSGYGLELAHEMKMLMAIRAVAGRGELDVVPTLLIHDVPARFRTRRKQYLDQVVTQLIPRVAREGLATFCDVFCDRGYFSRVETARILQAAAASGLHVKLHAEQLAHTGAVRLAAALGAVSADHLDRATASDIRAMRKTDTIATLLPGSVFHLGGRYPPARRFIERGVPVALATNFNPGSSPSFNMQVMLSLACSQMRMTPAESIVAATVNGAYAAGRGADVGSLEAGKQGDVVLMKVEDYREIPYFFGVNHCAAVVKRGRRLV